MSWEIILILIFVGLLALMFTGMPIAFSFFGISLIVMYILQGPAGMRQLVLGMYDATAKFSLAPIPFFMIMGEVFYQSGIVSRAVDSISRLVKRVPGRLSVITLLAGGLFAALSGSVVANTAMFGSLMLPDMSKRGYSKWLTTGSIMASGALAMVIPPSSLAVLLGSIAGISVGRILVGAILPGVVLMLGYIGFVLGACIKDPSLAPPYEDEVDYSTKEKFKSVMIDLVPLVGIFVIFIGLMFSGLATPTEAAAIGALGAYILTAAYRKLNGKLVMSTLISSLKVTATILIIIAGSAGFSQILSLTGASRGAVMTLMSVSSNQHVLLWLMLGVATLLGFFMEQTAIMMITLPIFMPIIQSMGVNEVWFAVLFLICLQIGQLTPPVGLALFTMKSVSPPEVTMQDIYKGATPFLIIDLSVLVLLYLVPPIITFLPGRM